MLNLRITTFVLYPKRGLKMWKFSKQVPFIETDEGTEDYSSLLSLTVRAYKPL